MDSITCNQANNIRDSKKAPCISAKCIKHKFYFIFSDFGRPFPLILTPKIVTPKTTVIPAPARRCFLAVRMNCLFSVSFALAEAVGFLIFLQKSGGLSPQTSSAVPITPPLAKKQFPELFFLRSCLRVRSPLS